MNKHAKLPGNASVFCPFLVKDNGNYVGRHRKKHNFDIGSKVHRIGWSEAWRGEVTRVFAHGYDVLWEGDDQIKTFMREDQLESSYR